MLVGAFGAFFFKKASTKFSINPKKLIKNYYFFIAATLYVISSLGYLLILKTTPLSILYPMTAITYLWTAIIAYILLKEKFTRTKIIGIALIILGIALMNIV